MHRSRLASVFAVAALAVSLFAAPTAVHGATLPVCDNAWHVEPHPENGQVLRSVSARWIQGAWAVGSVYDQQTSVWRTYIEHWNGAVWNHIASPNVDPSSTPGDNELYGVNGIGADVWAVGGYQESPDHTHAGGHFPLVMYFGGHGWSVVPDDPALGQATLTGVWKVSPTDVWAVGSAKGGGSQTLTMHWNGKAWTRVVSIDADASTPWLAGVTVRRDGTAFAVGASAPVADPARGESLIDTWNGAIWSQMASPNPAPYRNVLSGVDRGPHALQKVWAVRYRQRTLASGPRPLIVRLDAKGWVVERVPNPYPGGWTELADVAVFGVPTFDSVGAVAVGNAYDATTGDYPVVIMRRCAP